MNLSLSYISYAALWGLVVLSSLVLQRALKEVVEFGEALDRSRPPIRQLPSFSLHDWQSGDPVGNDDISQSESIVVFMKLAGSSLTQSEMRHSLVISRLLHQRYGGKLYLVWGGTSEEGHPIISKALRELPVVAVLMDEEGVLASKLKVRSAPAAYLFEKGGRLKFHGYGHQAEQG